MSKEELEAMEVVVDYLESQAVEAMEKAVRKEIPWNEFVFWQKSFCTYSDKYYEIKAKNRRARA